MLIVLSQEQKMKWFGGHQILGLMNFHSVTFKWLAFKVHPKAVLYGVVKVFNLLILCRVMLETAIYYLHCQR